MIDYETFVKIKVLKDQHALKCSQIATELDLDYRTVEKWLDQAFLGSDQGRTPPNKALAQKQSRFWTLECPFYPQKDTFKREGRAVQLMAFPQAALFGVKNITLSLKNGTILGIHP